MNKKRILIIAACVVLIGACVLVYTLVIVPNTKYNNAVKAMQNKQYTEASIAFQELKNYKDSETRLLELHANELFDSGSYAEVVDMYATLPAEYQDHADDLIAMYADASAKRDEGKFDEAISIFTSLGNYTDCSTQIKQTLYLKAGSLTDNGQYDDAIRIYIDLGSYSDAADQITETKYRKAAALAEAGEYNDAIALYKELGDYKDSSNLALKAYADGLYARGNIADAYEVYKNLEEGYQTHSEDYKVKFDDAIALRTAGKYDDAIVAFELLGEYSDARDQVVETKYQKAASLAAAGEYSSAQEIYKELSQYKDSAVLARKMNADDLYSSGRLADAYEIYKGLDEKYQTHIDDYKALYDKALAKRDKGEYAEAKKILNSLGTYPDAANQITETSYLEANALAQSGEYDEAIRIFESLSGYKDSVSLIKKAKADQCYDSGDLAGAYEIYTTLEDKYQSHAADYEAFYDNAVALRSEGKYDDAMIVFKSLGAYSDANVQISETVYQKAASLAESGDCSAAIKTYEELGDYKDSSILAEKTAADQLYASGDIAGAYDAYVKLDEAYQTHIADYKALYDNALAKQADGQFDEALSIFVSLGRYPGANAQIIETNYLKASALSSSGDYDAAIALFEAMPDYKDSTDLMKKTRADKLYAYGHYGQASDIYKDLEEKYQTHLADYQAAYASAEASLDNKEFDKANLEFMALGSFSDSSERATKCLYEKAEYLLGLRDYTGAAEVYKLLGESEKVNQALYDNAVDLRDHGDFVKAAAQFAAISGYSDSEEQRYQTGLAAWKADKQSDAIAILNEILDYSSAKESIYLIGKEASDKQRFDISTTAFETVGMYKDATMRLSKDTYAWGVQLFDNGEFDKAAEIFASMGDFSDALERVRISQYAGAKAAYDAGDYENAAERFAALGDYEDSAEQTKMSWYSYAQELLGTGKFEQAKQIFISLSDYLNSAEQVNECDYCQAKAHMESENYSDAISAFSTLDDYKDSSQMLQECSYKEAVKHMNNGQYIQAAELFDNLDNYSDSKTMAMECRYKQAEAYRQAGDINTALELYQVIPDYGDSLEQAKACYYSLALEEEKKGNCVDAYSLYISAREHNDAKEKSEEMAYKVGIDSFSAGDYSAAVEWLMKAGNYDDSKEQIMSIAEYYFMTSQFDLADSVYSLLPENEMARQRLYELGQHFETEGNVLKAYNTYIKAADISEADKAAERMCEKLYQQADALMAQNAWEEAKELFSHISGYQDAESRIQEAEDLINQAAAVRAAKIKACTTVGEYVTFGTYPQTASGGDQTPIEWLVLDYNANENKSLLLSRYALDNKVYNEEYVDVTWATCSLRAWLNNEFLNKAFDTKEQSAILHTTVINNSYRDWWGHSADPGQHTWDIVFLLSYDEARKYLEVGSLYDSNLKSRVAPTAYVNKNGVYTSSDNLTENGKPAVEWWLRSPGADQNDAAYVGANGAEYDTSVRAKGPCVRPALWLDLNTAFSK